ncbi:MAG: hypothetical protein MUF49_24660 [Oculatellaceae cyanobacterium Prado106]|nr:hypothetical protein [Oculatellaceae cyanobacterium Prado106]
MPAAYKAQEFLSPTSQAIILRVILGMGSGQGLSYWGFWIIDCQDFATTEFVESICSTLKSLALLNPGMNLGLVAALSNTN